MHARRYGGGLTVSAVVVRESLAYATNAGAPPVAVMSAHIVSYQRIMRGLFARP